VLYDFPRSQQACGTALECLHAGRQAEIAGPPVCQCAGHRIDRKEASRPMAIGFRFTFRVPGIW
jgi:hypothetical protein